ncbi:SDR family NAD(P)-dependent oxidoreductase [Cryomorphaceae bacterium 1068]|nr:SDR family NAD(P)-dependent oxidoreductase [Cryomorphaceae bacterium 1068]
MKRKIVCITGASRGIGHSLVKEYLKQGHLVVAVSRNAGEIEVNSDYENSLIRVSANITTDKGIQTVKNRIEELGRLNVLIHNAGQLIYKPFADISLPALQDVYMVNVFAPFTLTQALLGLMEECHTITISSVGGVENSLKFPGLSAYSSSKAALNCLTQMWAEEFKDTKHTFNCLALGSVETEMFGEAFPGVPASCTPDEMASFIYNFDNSAPSVQNGKIISVSRSNP